MITTSIYKSVLALSVLLLSLLCSMTLEGKPPKDTSSSTTDTSGSQVPSNDEADQSSRRPVEVLGVFNKNFRADKEKVGMASLGDVIVIRVSNIDSLRRRAKCKDIAGRDLPSTQCKAQGLRLFINGRWMEGVEPEKGEPIRLANGDGEFHFRLDRNTQNNRIWAELLGSPPLFKKESFIIPVNVSVGLENDYPLMPKNDTASTFHIKRIHRAWFWGCFTGALISIIWLLALVKKRGLLSNRVLDLRNIEIWNPNTQDRLFSKPTSKPPYSMGRFQMAFWSVLIIVSFLFIWLITDAYDILTASILALLGISTGTSLSATIIDDNKQKAQIEETKALQLKFDDPTTLQTEKPLLLDKIKGNVLQLESKPSKGFFRDILEDANGISFHRWQMLMWTLVLGLLFIYTVWKRLSMPDFDPILLALQGITSGTYLGFKFPEKHN